MRFIHFVLLVWGFGACITPAWTQEYQFGNQGKLFTYKAHEFQLTAGGHLFLDGATYRHAENIDARDADIRDARLRLDLQWGPRWRMKAEADFSDRDIDYKDVILSYQMTSHHWLTFGQHREPIGLERSNSVKDMTFMERPLQTGLVPNRQVGLTFRTVTQHWTATLGAFGRAIDGPARRSISGRFTVTPSIRPRKRIHLGAALAYAEPTEMNAIIRVATRPETFIDKTRFLDSGPIDRVSRQRVTGLECAGTWGSFHYQSEWAHHLIQRNNGLETVQFEGWYVATGYILTGEHRPYDQAKGRFGRVAPIDRSFAIEVALRHGALNLNDHHASILGGASQITALAANVYLDQHSRLLLNYLRVDHDAFADGNGNILPNDDYAIIQARYQLVF